MMKDGTPARLLEHLELDGGWLTMEGLLADLPHLKRFTVERAVQRLKARGLVVSRMRLVNGETNGGSPHEYKAAV